MERFNESKFSLWESETHIPDEVLRMVSIVCREIGIDAPEERTIPYKNIWGDTIGYAKGLELSHCTSSYADGPEPDMSDVFEKWLGGLGFDRQQGYGDNGLDYSTNHHDTYWFTPFIYTPTLRYKEAFYDYE